MPILVLEDDPFDNNDDVVVGTTSNNATSVTSNSTSHHYNHRYMIDRVEDHRTNKDIKTLIVEHNDTMDDLVCTSFPNYHHSKGHSSFPSAHELRTDLKIIRRNCWNRWNSTPKKKKRQYVTYTICFVIVFIAFLCIIPSIKHYHTNKYSNHEQISSSSSNDENVPTTPNIDNIPRNDTVSTDPHTNFTIRKASYMSVVEYLTANHVTDMKMMIGPDTYQYQAVNWLANHDVMNLPLPTTGIDTYDGYMYISRYVLALLYFALGGPQWENSYHFLSSQSICLWNKQQQVYDRTTNDDLRETFFDAGVICANDADDHNKPIPRHLYLNANHILGEIPSEIGILTSLTKMKMEKNMLDGSIPTALCSLTNLVELSFTNNRFTKTIPSCIGTQLYNLQSISLSRNQLTGTVPTEWSNLKQLETILLSHNMIYGDPLPILNELPKLRNILLSGNELDGMINTTFLSSILLNPTNQIQKIDLSDNRFTTNKDLGLPSLLLNHNSSTLAVIDLSKNTLYGTIPSDISISTRLSYLSLYNNQLSGTIPTQISNLHGLQHFDLSDNNFDGNIPTEIGDMTHLRFLSLGKNDLFAAGTVPYTLSSLTNLEYLSIRNTNRIGKIPSFFDRYAKSLIYLDISHNSFTGALPMQFYSLSNLQIVMLNNNPQITGVIPITIGYWKNLHGAFFDGTKLSGSLDTICPLITFAQHEVVYADCHTGSDGSTKPSLQCSCCQCCSSLSYGCSESRITDLDKGLEYAFQMIDYSASIATIMDPNFQDIACIRDGVCY